MQGGPNPLIWNENRIVEILQVLFLFISIIFFSFFLLNFEKLKLSNFYKLLLIFYFFGITYFFFEEISWGQHLFGWKMLNFFNTFNTQNENNFHNISNLLNELPRSFLTIWCALSFILFEFIKKETNPLSKISFFVLPNKNLKKISLIIIITFLPDFIVDKLNLHPGHPIYNSEIYPLTSIAPHEVFDLLTFNFVKLSELHELLFCFYILTHSYYLMFKIK